MLNDVSIHIERGDRIALVAPNGASPVLDLAGGERDITNVEFWYQKASWGKKPEVRLYGRR